MSEIGAGGRTIIFVSHSMPAILRLCSRAILLDHGRVVADGPTDGVVRSYLELGAGRTSVREWTDQASAPGDDVARLKSVRVLPVGGSPAEEIDIRRALDVEVEYWTKAPGELRPSVNLHFYNDEGVCLFVNNDWNDRDWWTAPRTPGLVRAVCHIPGNFLAEGRVIVTAVVSTYNPTVVHAQERDAVAFVVVDRSEGDGVRGVFANEFPAWSGPCSSGTWSRCPRQMGVGFDRSGPAISADAIADQAARARLVMTEPQRPRVLSWYLGWAAGRTPGPGSIDQCSTRRRAPAVTRMGRSVSLPVSGEAIGQGARLRLG